MKRTKTVTNLSLKRKYDDYLDNKFDSKIFFSEYKIKNYENNYSQKYVINLLNYIKNSYQKHLENTLNNKDLIHNFVKYLNQLKYQHSDSIHHFNSITKFINSCNLLGITDVNLMFTNIKNSYNRIIKNNFENNFDDIISFIKKDILCFQLVLNKMLMIKSNHEEIINDFINHHNLIIKIIDDLIFECKK